MHIGCCKNCRYLDLFENLGAKCPRCRGEMVSLEIESAVWNRMDEKERQAILDEKVPKEQDRDELFKELWGDKYEGTAETKTEDGPETEPDVAIEEAGPESVAAKPETEPGYEPVESEVKAEPAVTMGEPEHAESEPESVISQQPEEAEADIVRQLFASEDKSGQEPEEPENPCYEYVYACYKCSALAGHDGEHDRYYCPECGSDMVEVGMSTKEWANLSKEEKRNTIEEAKIRHMVTQIQKASYEDSENTTNTPRIINVVNN